LDQGANPIFAWERTSVTGGSLFFFFVGVASLIFNYPTSSALSSADRHQIQYLFASPATPPPALHGDDVHLLGDMQIGKVVPRTVTSALGTHASPSLLVASLLDLVVWAKGLIDNKKWSLEISSSF
jgi:hypothetical protein